jgi:AraC-like DNA-binding protein
MRTPPPYVLTHTGPTPPARVATMLLPGERGPVDAAGHGYYESRHAESVDELLTTLREGQADAVLFSVGRCIPREAGGVARMVREFPQIPAVALLISDLPRVPEAVLTIGHSGVRRIVDVRRPTGWQELRVLLSGERNRGFERMIARRLREALERAPEEVLRFFDQLFVAPPHVSTVQQLAHRLDMAPGTLMSRFFRARLPAPKRFLSMARLVRVAYAFENPGVTIASVANLLEYSSPQAFGRHVQALLGMNATEFRRTTNGSQMLERFLDELVWPHHEVWQQFRPLMSSPDAAWPVSKGAASPVSSRPL